MSASSLGGINGAFPARLKTASTTVSLDITGPRGGEISYRKSSEYSVMKGPVPVLFFSLCFLAASLILLFPEIEVSFSTLTSRIVVTCLVFVGGVMLVLANDVVAWLSLEACELCLQPNETEVALTSYGAVEARAPPFHTQSLAAWKRYEKQLKRDVFPHLVDKK